MGLGTLKLRRPDRSETVCLLIAAGLCAQFVLRGELSLVDKSPVWDEQLHLRYGLDLIAEGPGDHGRDHPYPVSALFAAASRISADGLSRGRDLRVEKPAHLWPARRMNLALAAAGLLLLFGLAWYRFGAPAAVAVLAVGSFDPGWIAQARFATTDIALGLAFGAAAFVLVWLRRRDRWTAALVLGGVTGFGLTAKFSALLIPLCTPLVFLLPAPGEGFTEGLGRRTLRGLLWGGVSATVGLALYLLLMELFGVANGLGLGAGWTHVTDGLYRAAAARTAPRGVYLLGTWHESPSLAYFPVLLAAKTPLSVWVLVALAAATARGRAFVSEHRLWFVLSGAFLIVAIVSRVNLGHRHLTPVLPALWVLAAAGGLALWKQPRRGALYAGGLALVLVVEGLLFHPHYLPATNAIFGGQDRAHHVAVDSASDWGQDLPALRDYLKRHPPKQGPVHLAYFGNADPRAFLGPVVWRPCGQLGARPFKGQLAVGCSAPAEVFAISATCLVGATGRRVKGRWRLTEQSRCYRWLRKKKPHAILGGTIFVFRDVARKRPLGR